VSYLQITFANYFWFRFVLALISFPLKIWVWPEHLQTMYLLGFHDTFTTKTSLTRVQAVPRYSFSVETLEGLNTMRPTIGIMPSGLLWVLKLVKGDNNLFGSLLTSRYKKKDSHLIS
jgi:DNA cross-link repair 1B protein